MHTFTTPDRPFVVCIDPGHESENGVGAVGHEVSELPLVYEVGVRLKKLLEQSPDKYQVVMTKTSLHEYVTNRKRADIANHAKADLMLRIHADSGGHSGFATYYPTKQVKMHGHFGPPQTVLEQTGRYALPFHKGAMSVLSKDFPDLGAMPESRTFIGGKQGALTGSVFSEVPVLLVELCVVNNKHDADIAKTDEGKDEFAEALKAGIDAAIAEKSL